MTIDAAVTEPPPALEVPRRRGSGGSPLARYILIRFLLIFPTVLILVTLVFFLIRMTGDPITAALGGRLPADQLAERIHEAGYGRNIFMAETSSTSSLTVHSIPTAGRGMSGCSLRHSLRTSTAMPSDWMVAPGRSVAIAAWSSFGIRSRPPSIAPTRRHSASPIAWIGHSSTLRIAGRAGRSDS